MLGLKIGFPKKGPFEVSIPFWTHWIILIPVNIPPKNFHLGRYLGTPYLAAQKFRGDLKFLSPNPTFGKGLPGKKAGEHLMCPNSGNPLGFCPGPNF